METSKRRQIPTTNACQNFSFRGLRIKKNSWPLPSRWENYFRHSRKLHTSQQRQRPSQYAHARDITMAAACRAFGPTRAMPGIISDSLVGYIVWCSVIHGCLPNSHEFPPLAWFGMQLASTIVLCIRPWRLLLPMCTVSVNKSVCHVGSFSATFAKSLWPPVNLRHNFWVTYFWMAWALS